MPVSYILQQIGYKMGLSPDDSIQREVLLRFVREACDELYAEADMDGSLVEQYFKVNGNQTIAMPQYVGELRAVREFNSQIPVSINQMRPRYNVSNWPDMWRNWRLQGKQALSQAILNEGPVNITCTTVEDVVVKISGSTLEAENITEEVTMDELTKQTTNSFTDITGITKSARTVCDYVITDLDGVELSRIANNQVEAIFTIIDISQLPWSNVSSSAQDHFVEVLYKKPLPWMTHDGDEFPAKGYDNIIVNKCLQLWSEEQGKVDQALAYDQKARRSLARKRENTNRATEDRVGFIPNPHDQLLGRVRSANFQLRRGYTS